MAERGKKTMIGAILGDIIGAPYEFDRGPKVKDFGPLFIRGSEYTDDTVMTIAVADALMEAGKNAGEAEAKNLKAALEEKTKEKLNHLSDEEAKALLEAKWVDPIVKKLLALPSVVLGDLASKIKALVTKYATTLADVEARIESAEADIAELDIALLDAEYENITGGTDDE